MFKVLDTLIDNIRKAYIDTSEKWKTNEDYVGINLKKRQIIDIQTNEIIWNMIKSYRNFMAIHQLPILENFSSIQTAQNMVTARIKQLNSIEYKIHRYVSSTLEGKVPINKCFNDLFGIRIIIDSEFCHEDIEKHLTENFPNLKLIDSSKNGYIASHVYFMRDNTLFPWELQIWKKTDEKYNLQSHKLYKQKYTSWEQNYKNT